MPVETVRLPTLEEFERAADEYPAREALGYLHREKLLATHDELCAAVRERDEQLAERDEQLARQGKELREHQERSRRALAKIATTADRNDIISALPEASPDQVQVWLDELLG